MVATRVDSSIWLWHAKCIDKLAEPPVAFRFARIPPECEVAYLVLEALMRLEKLEAQK